MLADVTAYVRSGLQLVKRRRVLASAEAGLRAAIQRGTVVRCDIERVRDGQFGYLKALRHELQPGTPVDADVRARLAVADGADATWRAAAAGEIVEAYAAGAAFAPGDVPASFSPRSSAP